MVTIYYAIGVVAGMIFTQLPLFSVGFLAAAAGFPILLAVIYCAFERQ
jgi:hypothetical protein